MSDTPRRTLRCPHCGAPLPPESLQRTVTCAFCLTVSTPAEVAASAPGGRVAGESIAASAATCPRCGLPLFEGNANEIAMLGCGRCGGIWLDNTSAQRVVQTFDRAVVALADQVSTRAAFSVDLASAIACPTCRGPLARTRSPQSGIWIDVCGEHGTWFDRYELGVVFEALAPKAAPAATTYDGPTPDFREGANPELKELGKLLGYGVLGMVGMAAGAVVVAPGKTGGS
jgi:Zn-finger nucleic acid-binding protein